MIIGVAGRKRSGKDSFGRLCEESLGFTRKSFAAPLKACVMELFGLPSKFEEEEHKEDLTDIPGRVVGLPDDYATYRQLLQVIGTGVFRERFKDFWLDVAELDVGRLGDVVFCDVRYDNEAEWVIRKGGVVVRMERPGFSGSADTHISEVPISTHLVDYTISATNLKELYEEGVKTLEKISHRFGSGAWGKNWGPPKYADFARRS